MAGVWMTGSCGDWQRVPLAANPFILRGNVAPQPGVGEGRRPRTEALILHTRSADPTAWVLICGSHSAVRVNGWRLDLGLRLLADKDEIVLLDAVAPGVGRFFFSTEVVRRLRPLQPRMGGPRSVALPRGDRRAVAGGRVSGVRGVAPRVGRTGLLDVCRSVYTVSPNRRPCRPVSAGLPRNFRRRGTHRFDPWYLGVAGMLDSNVAIAAQETRTVVVAGAGGNIGSHLVRTWRGCGKSTWQSWWTTGSTRNTISSARISRRSTLAGPKLWSRPIKCVP